MTIRSSLRAAGAIVLLALTSGASWSQVEEPPPWQEAEVAAPAWSLEALVEFPMEGQGSMRLAIDPSTISFGADGVVRYVFVARSSSGAVNGIFEGIRCQTGEVKQYARWDPDAGQWRATQGAGWKALDYRGNTRRAMQMAQAGVCNNKAPARSAAWMMDALQRGRTDQIR